MMEDTLCISSRLAVTPGGPSLTDKIDLAH